MDALVGAGWLASRLGEPGLVVADVRWYLDPSRRGRDAWRVGHIPGAVFLDVDEDLSAPGGGRGLPAGRHPWPSEEQVARVDSLLRRPETQREIPRGVIGVREAWVTVAIASLLFTGTAARFAPAGSACLIGSA